jgi:hypothetical protein
VKQNDYEKSFSAKGVYPLPQELPILLHFTFSKLLSQTTHQFGILTRKQTNSPRKEISENKAKNKANQPFLLHYSRFRFHYSEVTSPELFSSWWAVEFGKLVTMKTHINGYTSAEIRASFCFITFMQENYFIVIFRNSVKSELRIKRKCMKLTAVICPILVLKIFCGLRSIHIIE